MRKLTMDELNRLSVENFRQAAKWPMVIVLDNVRSHHNVGSVFRTADAFRAEAVYLCGITGKPPHRDILKTALGATESVAWTYYEKTEYAIAQLKASGWKIVAIEQVEGATLLHRVQVSAQEKYALVFGNEVEGISQAVLDSCDMAIEIPQFGTKHSLNITVSAGIVCWEFVRHWMAGSIRAV
ncbi:MAG: RNA methyltransferase [Chitinophagales bacterium]|nr:RNA methyltransferase [Chitinophagales bacterium]MDW8420059.1 RNA methyltransferase [Chitinophagales bacterium]